MRAWPGRAFATYSGALVLRRRNSHLGERIRENEREHHLARVLVAHFNELEELAQRLGEEESRREAADVGIGMQSNGLLLDYP